MVLGTPGITTARKVKQETDKLGIYCNGTKIGEMDCNGNLKIKGEMSVLQTFT